MSHQAIPLDISTILKNDVRLVKLNRRTEPTKLENDEAAYWLDMLTYALERYTPSENAEATAS